MKDLAGLVLLVNGDAGDVSHREIPQFAFAQLPARRGEPHEIVGANTIDGGLIGAPGVRAVRLIGNASEIQLGDLPVRGAAGRVSALGEQDILS